MLPKTKTEFNAQVNAEMIAATERVFLLTAFVKMIEPIVTGYQKEILRRHAWSINPEMANGEDDQRIILDPSQVHLLCDADFAVYLQESYDARVASNLTVLNDDKGLCPLLIAQNELRQAKHELIDVMSTLTGVKSRSVLHFEKREQYVNLLLRALAPHCRPAAEILNEVRVDFENRSGPSSSKALLSPRG